MRVHVNGRDIVTPDGFSLVNCNCTLRYNQKTEIKPKLLTVLKVSDSKKALLRSCQTHGQRLIIHFYRFGARSC